MGYYTYNVAEVNGATVPMCTTERFYGQPAAPFCTGVLVGPRLVATAGHCITSNADALSTKFVFGFRMTSATAARLTFANTQIYTGKRLVATGTASDWSIVELDRAVTDHRISPIRTSGKIADAQGVFVVGHPYSLPAKAAGGAVVRTNTAATVFITNLDTYGGNSGSPVVAVGGTTVEGLLVEGDADFVMSGTCAISHVCTDTGCMGEKVTRSTEFTTSVPRPDVGTTGQWLGCRGTGFHVCAEKVAATYTKYYTNHPNCIKNATCSGLYFTCSEVCPAPTATDL